VTADVAQRVRQAAETLGYEVNPAGRSLRLRSTETVGLVIADITNPFFPSLVKALEDALAGQELGLLLADASNNVARERDAVQRLLARRVDALVVTPVSRSGSRGTISEAAARCPVVQLDRRASSDAHYVGMDNVAAIQSVLLHLSTTGKRRPVFVGSDPQISTTWERQRAFARFAPFGDRVLVGEFSLDWGRTATREALARWPSTDAIVCADDLIAAGAVEELAVLGVPVPATVAVVGFDDTLLSRLQTPPMSSVRQPLLEMAVAAVALAAGPVTSPRKLLHRGQLVVRASTLS